MLCSEALTVNSDYRGGQMAVLTCKRWSCPICAPVNRRRVIGLGRKGKPEKFMTLTAKPDRWASPDEAARGMRDAFARLIRLIRKENPSREVAYLRVFEKTKNGWPHLHVLLRAPWIDQRWLSQTWEDLTGAFIVDIRVVDNVQKAVFYITKYIGKDLEKFEGCQRWFRSKNWNEPEEIEVAFFGSHWEQIQSNGQLHWQFLQRVMSLEARGAEFEVRNRNYVRWRWPSDEEKRKK